MSDQKEIAIDDTPFYKSLRKRSNVLLFMKDGKIRNNLSGVDEYQKSILETCLRISSLFKTLRLSRFFLGERLNIPVDSDLKIKNAEFIRYHIECYFIRITTFKDLIVKLFNRTFKLDKKEGNGLFQNVKNEAQKQNITNLLNLLNDLENLLKNVAPIRNKITYGDYYDAIDLVSIEAEELIKNTGKGTSMKNDEYKAVLNKFLTKNIIEMYKIEVAMATYTLRAYKDLYKVRRAKEKTLKDFK